MRHASGLQLLKSFSSAVSSVCLLAVFVGLLAEVSLADAPVPLRILPLGDSITYGAGPAPSHIIPGGYRSKLYTELTAKSFAIIYVGDVAVNPSPILTAAGQTAHCGFPGWTIIEISNRIEAWMDTYKPDVVLLHIGTNDMIFNRQESALDRLDTLINQITHNRPDVELFVAGITPLTYGNAWANHRILTYNKAIKETVVPKYHDKLKRQVFFVDQYVNFVNNGVVDPTHIPDGAHPDQIGYDGMADTWAKAIAAAIATKRP